MPRASFAGLARRPRPSPGLRAERLRRGHWLRSPGAVLGHTLPCKRVFAERRGVVGRWRSWGAWCGWVLDSENALNLAEIGRDFNKTGRRKESSLFCRRALPRMVAVVSTTGRGRRAENVAK